MTVQRGDHGRLPTLDIRLARAPDGGFRVDVQIDEREFPAGTLDPAALKREVLGVDVGERLFAALVADARVRGAWEVAGGLHPRRRIRLRIDESAAELHALPWESMVDPSPTTTARVLAADRDTPFSRYAARAAAPPGAHEGEIAVLTAVASPRGLAAYGLAEIDRDGEHAALAAAVAAAPAGRVRHTALAGPCTLAALEQALERGCHVLHIVGHGAVRRGGGEMVMFLEDAEGAVELVEATRFAAMIERLSEAPRLVVLMSCETGKRSAASPGTGFVPTLLAAGVPAVLAMQDRMPMITATGFTRAFYDELWSSGAIDRAANRARAVLMTERLPGSAVPVLYAVNAGLQLGPEADAEGPPVVVPVVADAGLDDAPGPGFGAGVTRFSLVRDGSGRIVVIALDAEHRGWIRRELAGGWSGWTQVCTDTVEIAAVVDRSGALALSMLGVDGDVRHTAQQGSGWREPVRLGRGEQLAAVRRQDGGTTVLARDGDGCHVHVQRVSGGPWQQEPDLAGAFRRIVAVGNGLGHVVVFGVTDEPRVVHATQTRPGAAWSDWQDTAEGMRDIHPALGPDGCLYFFGPDAEGKLWYGAETRPGTGVWKEWDQVAEVCIDAVGLVRADGEVQVYWLDVDGFAWRRVGKDAWGPWEPLGGPDYVRVRVIEGEGRTLVFASTGDGRLDRLVCG